MNENAPSAVRSPRTRYRRSRARKSERIAPYDTLRKLAAQQPSPQERAAFAVVGFALLEAWGWGSDAKRRAEARRWLETERGRGMCIVFDIHADWCLRMMRER